MDPQILDLFVSGPGFGESVLIGWWEKGKRNWGIIDCYAPYRGEALLEWLRGLGVSDLKFLVLTHPHLDHIHNVGELLRNYRSRVEYVWWWGGLAPSTYVAFFEKMCSETPTNKEYGLTGKSLLHFFRERRLQADSNGRPVIEEAYKVRQLFPYPPDEPSVLRLLSLSPWPDPLLNFTGKLAAGLRIGQSATLQHRDANDASIALLLQFGDAQVLLGGDTESANWSALRNSPVCPRFNPCVVKVSHHGSENGSIKEMWEQRGFFGFQENPPYAVITPWRRVLPDLTMVWKIATACKAVYVTGRSKGARRVFPSFVHFSINSAGVARLASKSDNVEEYLAGQRAA